MRKKLILTVALLSSFTLLSIAFAGHHYHGHGGKTNSWENMSQMDKDKDDAISFEEYSEGKLRKSFNMIDSNGDGKIDKKEYHDLLEVHGLKR